MREHLNSRQDLKVDLGHALTELLMGPLVWTGEALTFQQLCAPRGWQPEDVTAFEAATNKVHISDYSDRTSSDELLCQGITFAEQLAERLAGLPVTGRVLLSLDFDSDEVTVRFFVKREGVIWNIEDIEQYQEEGVIQWDVS
jgi:hypothetical protein